MPTPGACFFHLVRSSPTRLPPGHVAGAPRLSSRTQRAGPAAASGLSRRRGRGWRRGTGARPPPGDGRKPRKRGRRVRAPRGSEASSVRGDGWGSPSLPIPRHGSRRPFGAPAAAPNVPAGVCEGRGRPHARPAAGRKGAPRTQNRPAGRSPRGGVFHRWRTGARPPAYGCVPPSGSWIGSDGSGRVSRVPAPGLKASRRSR